MVWISPSGFSDPDANWSDEENSYDENTGTGSIATKCLNGILYLSIPSSLFCPKIRIFLADVKGAAHYDADVNISVRNGGVYKLNVKDGIVEKDVWVELPLSVPQEIDEMSVRWDSNAAGGSHLVVYEADFWSDVSGWIPKIMAVS